jgi:hypothetical protein
VIRSETTVTRAIRRQLSTRATLALMCVVAAAALAACSRPPSRQPSAAVPTSGAPALAAERARCADRLGHYQLVTGERWRFRIPIDRAMAIVVDDPELLRPTLPATSSSAPANEPTSQRSTP